MAFGLGGMALLSGAPASAAPSAGPSPTTMTMTVRDDPHRIIQGDEITYTIVASNNGDTDNTDFLVVVSWEPADFVSFTTPDGWLVNLPGTIPGAPDALSTYNDPMLLAGNSSVSFTLVLRPHDVGQFEMAATLFSMLENQTQSTEIERTPVSAPHGHP
jgi:hypothetical protein